MSTQIQKSTRSEGGSWHRTLPLAVVAATWLTSASSAGAVDIQSIQLGNVNDGPDALNQNGVTYRGQSRSITSFTDANGRNWDLTGGTTPTLTLRRSNATGSSPNRQVVWGRRASDDAAPDPPYIVLPSQPTTTQAALGQNNIFSGTDNLFANTGNTPGNQSDVERADVLFAAETASADLGVTVFERGIFDQTGQHDGFQIAAITDLDGTGAPSQYGKLVTQNTNSWGKNSLTGNQNYVVLRKNGTNTSTNLSFSALVPNQDIGGVVIPLTDLVPAGTTIYGYSLFAADVPSTATSTDLVNSNFPTNTPESSGGLDLVAANLGVVRRRAVPFGFSPSLGLLILGATWGTQSLWQRYRIKPVK